MRSIKLVLAIAAVLAVTASASNAAPRQGQGWQGKTYAAQANTKLTHQDRFQISY